jgi:hypothetical protein
MRQQRISMKLPKRSMNLAYDDQKSIECQKIVEEKY